MSALESPNNCSANVLASNVLPTPVGPSNANVPIGRRGELVGYYVASAGALGVLALAMTRQDQFWIANALYLSMVFVISALGAVAVGALGDAVGLHWAFVTSALVTLVSVPLLFMLPGDRSRAQPSG